MPLLLLLLLRVCCQIGLANLYHPPKNFPTPLRIYISHATVSRHFIMGLVKAAAALGHRNPFGGREGPHLLDS